MEDDLNSRPLSLQFLAIILIGTGLAFILFPWVAPVYLGFSWTWLAISLTLFGVGIAVFRLAIALSKNPKPSHYWWSLFILGFILLALAQFLIRNFLNYPTEEQMMLDKVQRKVARIYLNLIIFIGIFSVWIQLFRPKIRHLFKGVG